MGKKILNSDDKKLAEDHVTWYMQLLRSQFAAWLDVTEKLMVENFYHGIKHGRELEREKWIWKEKNCDGTKK